MTTRRRGFVAYLLAVASITLAAGAVDASSRVDGWVSTNKGTNLRDRPGTVEGRRIAALPPGTPVRVVSSVGDWLEVEVGGDRGWLFSGLVSDLPAGRRPERPGVPATTLAPINVRTGPGFAHGRRLVLREGMPVRVVARDGDWMEIRSGEGEGWVHRAYLAAVAKDNVAGVGPRRLVEGASRPSLPAGEHELLLAVITPDNVLGSARFLRRTGSDRLYARGEDLVGWRLAVDGLEPVLSGGESWYPLDGVPGLKATLDEATQRLQLETGVESFQRYSLDFLPSRFMEPTAVQGGAFLNYELVGTGGGAAGDAFDGRIELGLFNRLGDGSANFVLRDTAEGSDFVRLQTAWTVDLPERRSSLVVGDSLATGVDWSRSVHLGGIQYGTNYRTEPGFLAYPLLGFEGEAVTPSTFELYIDQALRVRERIPAGPFELNNLPVVNGRGDYQLILRDALGREIVTDQRFISSSRLLRKGLREFSWSLGAIRESLGAESNRYGRMAALVTERRGLTDRFTLDLHGELLEDQQTAGVGGSWAVQKLGVVDLSAAGSSSPLGDGGLLGFGFSRYQKRFNFSVDYERAGERFARLGAAAGERRSKELLQARVSGRPIKTTSLSLAYGLREQWDGSESELVTLNVNTRFPGNWFMTASGVRTVSGEATEQFAVSLSRFFGSKGITASARTGGATGDTAGLTWRQNAPTGLGMGYSIATEAGDRDRLDGSFELNTGVGSLSMQAANFNGTDAYRASWRGALATVGGEWFASRAVRDSFAIVRVGEEKGVRVYHENQMIGRTDRKGRVVIETMLPYQRNALRVEEADLEIGARVETFEMLASTRPRSGVVLDFDVHRSHDALVVVHDSRGEPLPLGTMLTTESGERRFRVARRGEAFLTDIGDALSLTAEVDGEACAVTVEWPEGEGVLPTIGPLVCEVQP